MVTRGKQKGGKRIDARFAVENNIEFKTPTGPPKKDFAGIIPIRVACSKRTIIAEHLRLTEKSINYRGKGQGNSGNLSPRLFSVSLSSYNR